MGYFTAFGMISVLLLGVINKEHHMQAYTPPVHTLSEMCEAADRLLAPRMTKLQLADLIESGKLTGQRLILAQAIVMGVKPK